MIDFCKKNIIWMSLIAVVCLSISVHFISRAAVSDTNKKNYVTLTNDEIESETFWIGMHLIHKNAMTDVSYRIAQLSQAEYAQYRLYYKDEDEVWYRIDSVQAVSDLNSAKAISFDELKEWKARYETDGDGRTTNLVSNESTTLFDLDKPMDPQEYAQLASIKQLYLDIKDKSKKTKVESAYLEVVEPLFAVVSKKDEVLDYSDQMQQLLSYKTQITSNATRHSYVEMVDEVLQTADYARRAAIYAQLLERLEAVDAKIVEIDKEANSTVSGEDDPKLLYSQLHDDIKQAKNDITQSRKEYLRLLPNPDDSVIDMLRAKYIEKLLLLEGDSEECDKCVRRLCAIEAIAGDYIENEVVERAVLKNEVVPKARRLYKKVLDAGDDAEVARVEYEAVLTAYLSRMGLESARKYVLSLIDSLIDLSDSDHESSKLSLKKFALFLDRTYAQLLCDTFGDQTKSKLLTKKQQLTKKWQEALDEENIALASELQAKIDAVDAEIEEHMKKYMKILSDDDATESERAKARAALIEHSSGAVLNALADHICEIILNSDEDMLAQLRKDAEASQEVIDRYDEDEKGHATVSGNSVSGNSVSNNRVSKSSVSSNKASVIVHMPTESTSVFGEGVTSEQILQDVGLTMSGEKTVRAYEALAVIDTAAARAITPKIETALAAAKEPDSKFAAIVTEMLSNVTYAMVTTPTEEMTYDTFTELIEAYYGKPVSMLTDEMAAAVIIALYEYDDFYGSTSAKRLIDSLLKQEEGNAFLFTPCKKHAGSYMSLRAIAYAKDMRVFTEDAGMSVTLQKKNAAYKFEAGCKSVLKKNKEHALKGKVVNDGELYISEDDAIDLFDLIMVSLPGKQKAIVCTDEMIAQEETLLEWFEEGGDVGATGDD